MALPGFLPCLPSPPPLPSGIWVFQRCSQILKVTKGPLPQTPLKSNPKHWAALDTTPTLPSSSLLHTCPHCTDGENEALREGMACLMSGTHSVFVAELWCL